MSETEDLLFDLSICTFAHYNSKQMTNGMNLKLPLEDEETLSNKCGFKYNGIHNVDQNRDKPEISSSVPEIFNCNSPDTRNTEVLINYGLDKQKKKWVFPIIEGEIKSCFAIIKVVEQNILLIGGNGLEKVPYIFNVEYVFLWVYLWMIK
uniref:Uncharacterized protein n=1 Tax=Strongyloides venezuelensis TaxID=75913 RepID=A0A0K0ETT3_STRVS